MKKICLCLIVCAVLLPVAAFALVDDYTYGMTGGGYAKNDPCGNKQVIAFEYKGKKYFIEDLEQFFKSAHRSDMCISGFDGVQSLYHALYTACMDGLSSLEDQVGIKVPFVGNASLAVDKVRLHQLDNDKQRFCYCQLEKEKLQKRADAQQKYYSHNVVARDVQTCVDSIKVHTDESFCPVVPSVTDSAHLANFANISSMLQGRYYFPKPMAGNPFTAVFNGYVLVVCDGARPVHIVKPSFSGFEKCQGGFFESLPGRGSVPDGLYLIQHSAIQELVGKKMLDWGKYRMLLLPEQKTNTYGRTSMYLHGTHDPDKRRSGGCISLGINIDSFVDDFYKNKNRDMIVIVSKDGVVDQEWNK